ncbi:MAG: hypothetical protein AABZ60_05495 [Planctomycetota bacterium]
MTEEKKISQETPSQAKRKNTLWVDSRQFKDNNVGVDMSNHLDDYGLQHFLSRYYLPLLILTLSVILIVGGYFISKLL